MREVRLSSTEMATMAALVGAKIATISPLHRVSIPQELRSSDPVVVALVDQHMLEKEEETFRPNVLGGAVAYTCADPEELLALRPMDPALPTLAAGRRGQLWVQCEVAADGAVRLTFPFSRDLMIGTVMAAFSSDNPEAEPSGFRFVGSAPEAFALTALAAHLADHQSVGMSAAEDVVAEATADLSRTLAFSAISGPEQIDQLATDKEARSAAVTRLTDDGHLVRHGRKLSLSPAAAAALAAPADAAVAVERWTLGPGSEEVSSFHAYRCGNRSLGFRPTSVNGALTLEWTEVTRSDLRNLAAATLLPPERLRAMAGER